MVILGIKSNKDNNRPETVASKNTAPLSNSDEVRNARANLKAKGIKDWEILDVWSEVAHSQGNYAVADNRFFYIKRARPF